MPKQKTEQELAKRRASRVADVAKAIAQIERKAATSGVALGEETWIAFVEKRWGEWL